ncbi:uncharacterized protein G2W53_041954 [Senna tora]|uniref:Uncharacterized protein n=1 Tax=Senna tora TaxID=362788 RepID=A0A834SI98_9FABA|nr:uncharacterized protein G2W53_041954 [Senna tora]
MYRTYNSQCEAEKLVTSVEKEIVPEDELENYFHKNLIIRCRSLQEIYRKKKCGISPVPKGKEEEEEIVTHKMENTIGENVKISSNFKSYAKSKLVRN